MLAVLLFLFLHKNVPCGSLLEAPYIHNMFSWRKKKITSCYLELWNSANNSFVKFHVRWFHSASLVLNAWKILSVFNGLWGWSGVAKMLCILHHWGVQLISWYSWARPAILVARKGREGMFLFLLFLHFRSCSLSSLPLSCISCIISSVSFLPALGDNTKCPTKVDVSLNPNTINQFSGLTQI